MKSKEASLPSWRWRVRLSLLIVGLVTNTPACWSLLFGPPGPRERHYPSPELITPTNTIGFEELWHFELGGLEREKQTLLVADIDEDSAEELLLSTEEANRLQVIKDGQVAGEVQLQVPVRAWLDRSQVLEGTHLAKILSTGVNLSLVDLSTGEVVEALGHVDVAVVGVERVFFEDILGDTRDEFIVSRYVNDHGRWETAVFNSEGEELWRRNFRVLDILYTGDLDGDGQKEIVTSSWSIIDSQGNVKRIGQGDVDTEIFWAGDLEGDGTLELVAGLSPHRVERPMGVYRLDGRPVWSYMCEEVLYGAVGDIDGDGKKEIAIFDRHIPGTGFSARAVGSADYYLLLFDTSGRLLWNYTVHSTDLYPGGFADVNGDGRDELVFLQPAPRPRTLYVYGTVP